MVTQPEAQNKKEVVIIHFKALEGCQIVQLCALVLEFPRFMYLMAKLHNAVLLYKSASTV